MGHEQAGTQQSFSRGLKEADLSAVECLGMRFKTDDERRAFFSERLRERLQDPEFRKIDGFPIASDEDILQLSDPPYYTACPNPFLRDLVLHACTGRTTSAQELPHEPLTIDVSSSRDTLIYSAHAYHTKVPPLAIAEYIKHFTQPGDVVLDAFAGSGMAAVACSISPSIRDRQVVLVDLSPGATFISATYSSPPDPSIFSESSAELLVKCDTSIGDLWKIGCDEPEEIVEFQIWTESFTCPNCSAAIESTAVVAATDEIGTAKEFRCPHCDALVSKAPTKESGASRLTRLLRTAHDHGVGTIRRYVHRAPVFAVVHTPRGRQRRATSDETRRSLDSLQLDSEFWYPTNPVIAGERYLSKDCLAAYGITHIHHFYLPRQLKTFSCLWDHAVREQSYARRKGLLYFLTSNALGMTVLNRYGPTHYSQVNKYFSGTLYVPSTIAETCHRYTYTHKRERLIKAFRELQHAGFRRAFISTQSSTNLSEIPDCSIDYIFVDPPFGRNLQYSELNQVWESWLRVRTNRACEAVLDSSCNRGVRGYTVLMSKVFQECYRTLRTGRWITVAFHNSSNAIWMSIQESLAEAGFVVADVRTLDKKRETYKQLRQGTVKQDLVITAYKPGVGFEQKFVLHAGTETGVWDFIRSHLDRLPVFVQKHRKAEPIVERQNYLLFDRMVAFHVQRGISVPMSAGEFYSGLVQKFLERDGMYFLPDQAAEYDKKRLAVEGVDQLDLFVSDEASAIQWLRQKLLSKPQTLQEIHPQFLKESGAWSKYETPLELGDLLRENFLRYDYDTEVPSQIHSYLSTNFKDLRNLDKSATALRQKARDRWYVPDPNRAADIQKLREQALSGEFKEYCTAQQKKLKTFRLEAVRIGFRRAWQERDYATIISVAEKLPEHIVQEDPMLLMWYTNSLTRSGRQS